jgi:hypothetical protein
MTSSGLDDAIRKAIDLNVRYYSSLGRLTVDYWTELLSAVVTPAKPAGSSGQFTAAVHTAQSATPATVAKAAAMVMEAASGSVAQGVFMVENHLNSEVDSVVVASFFKDPSGNAIQPQFTFDPPRIALKPGEQILVRVLTTIGADLEADTRYSGEFAVPGLKGTSIPVVLRSQRKQ